MLKKLRQRISGNSNSSPRKNNSLVRHARRLRLENLEVRHMLTGGLTLAPLSAQTLQGGAPLQIPINATDTGGNPVTYTVTSSNPAISASLPTGNPYLVLNVTHTSSGAGDPSFSGTMILELFANLAPTTVAQIVTLTNEGFYNGVVFNRVASSGGSPFVIQAGEPTAADAGITVPTMNNEINENLRYTSSGVLGMARTSADDTNNSQFFITGGPESFLDFQYTIFGRLVSGDNVRAEINAVPQNNSNGTGDGTPLSPVTITSASIINDPYDLALQVSAPLGTTGTSTITVTANDSVTGGTDTQTFVVTMNGDSTDPGPFLKAITPPTTSVNTPITFQLPFFDLNPAVNPPTFSNDTASNPNLNISLDPSTGQITVTPSNGLVGVQSISVEVSSAVSQAPSTRTFPLFISPAAPTSIELVSTFDTGSSNSDGITSLNNSSGSKELQFEVDGVTAGDTVLLFDGSTQIGSAVASSSSVIITTDGTHSLTDGSHQITAEQVLANQTYSVGNYKGTTNLTSAASSAVNLTVDAAGPTFTTTPVTAAQAGQPYIYTAQASDSVSSGLTYSAVTAPAGFTIDPNSGVVTWTPTAGQVGSQAVQLRATDLAGNTIDQSYSVTVTSGPAVTIVSTTTAANSRVDTGGTVPIIITFSSAVNVTGTPQLTLNDGAIVNYSSGSGSNTLTFNYTVGATDITPRLDYASTSSLSANGGTIQDASLADAVLTLPATGTDGLASQNISINTSASNADLKVTIASSSATTMIGGSVSFTITVTNLGPTAAQSVTLSDTLPATMTFGTQTQTSGPTFTKSNSGNTITDTIATLASGASATFTIVAEVNQTVGVGTVMTDTATVSSTTTDSTPANNTASASTTATVSGVVLTTDPFDATKNELMIGGTAGNDNISITMAAVGKVNVKMNGTTFGPFAVTGRIVAMGRLGNDVITVGPLVTLPTFLYGGLGNDTLTGGGGNNVLVGGGGTDVLVGGPGRNVIIAGAGASKLYAAKLGVTVGSNSGSILIGGTTNFDANDAALNTIMQEWGSTSDAYATRVSKIRSGSLAGGVALTSATVHQAPTRVIDQLYASTGGYDWFMAPSLTDQMLGIDPHKKSLLAFN